MLLRLILTAAVIALVVVFVRRARARRERAVRPPAIDARTVRCAHCAVYFPEREAVMRNGLVYCGRAHAETATAKS